MESSPAAFRQQHQQQQLHQREADLVDTEGHASLFWWQGRRAAVITDHNGLLLEQIISRPAGGCLPSWCSPAGDGDAGPSAGRVQYVPFSEILSARYLPIRRYCSSFSPCQRQRHYAELQVLQRDPARPWQWSLKSVELAAEQPAMVKAWVGQVRQRLQQLTYRPQRLLVFVNPFGGKRRARRTWQAVAAPILAAAGVDCQVVETAYQGHAEAAVKALTLEQLQGLDGLVAVGGDGLFSELLTAVLTHSHLGAALQLRLGHVPAGSTDAVACTLHGTRDPTTAALHIALGDCTALDVGRMVTLPEGSTKPTAAAAVASAAATGSAGSGISISSISNGPSQQQQRSGAGALSDHVQQQQASPALCYGFTSVGSCTELLRDGVNAERSEQQASIAAGGGGAAVPHPSRLGKHAAGSTGSGKPAARQQRRWQQQQQRRRGESTQQQEQQQQGQQEQQQEQAGSDGVSVFVPQLRHFVCVANFGFLGDVMELSERLRWAGPIRYDIAGVLRFLMLRHYKATVWYKPAPSTAQAAAAASVPGTAQQHPSQPSQQQRWRPEDAVVSPAAVAPLPHHQAPALHAKMSGGAAAADWRQQLPWCVGGPGSHCSSDSSGSRRSSLDGSAPCSGPLHTVAVESLPPAPGGRGGGGSSGGGRQQQQQQVPKSVSFMPQVAAVHVSAASFSSRGSAPPGANSAAAAAAAASRASSVTSGGSGSRCHSRCSRCTAAALHHSSSRQSFTHIHSLGGSEPPDAEAADSGAHTTLPPAVDDDAAGAGIGAAPPAPGSPPGDGWVKVEGRFASIMCVVTSCISDKSRAGLVPEAHLADGRLALVMVEGCSRLQYLRFLVQLASRGIVPGSLPFVRVEYATHVQVESEGGASSSWNVDGELLRHGRVNVGVHAGLVDVFARGVELM